MVRAKMDTAVKWRKRLALSPERRAEGCACLPFRHLTCLITLNLDLRLDGLELANSMELSITS